LLDSQVAAPVRTTKPNTITETVNTVTKGGKQYRVLTKMTRLGPPMDLKSLNSRIIVSPDGKRFACTVKNGDKSAVLVDGVKGNEYFGIIDSTLKFSPDSHRYAYVAVDKPGNSPAKCLIIADGNVVGIHDQIIFDSITFSSDGKALAYCILENKKYRVVVNGQKQRPFDLVMNNITLSRKGAQIAYVASENKKSSLIINGRKAGQEYNTIGISSLLLSPNGDRHMYFAKRGSNCVAVLDRKEVYVCDDYVDHTSAFSPDVRRTAFGVIKGKKHILIVDGVQGKPYDQIGKMRDGKLVMTNNGSMKMLGTANENVVFSPDSKRLAYIAKQGQKYMVVVDGKEGKLYDDIDFSSHVFSPDSSQCAYIAKSNTKSMYVINGVEHKAYARVGDIRFSPDGQRHAYPAAIGNNQTAYVVDGKENRIYRDITYKAAFSPNSKHLAYIAQRRDNRKCVLVVDGEEGTEDLEIVDGEFLAYGPQPSRLVYAARRNGKRVLLMNGIETCRIDGALAGSKVFFAASNKIYHLGLVVDETGTRVVRVETEVEAARVAK